MCKYIFESNKRWFLKGETWTADAKLPAGDSCQSNLLRKWDLNVKTHRHNGENVVNTLLARLFVYVLRFVICSAYVVVCGEELRLIRCHCLPDDVEFYPCARTWPIPSGTISCALYDSNCGGQYHSPHASTFRWHILNQWENAANPVGEKVTDWLPSGWKSNWLITQWVKK